MKFKDLDEVKRLVASIAFLKREIEEMSRDISEIKVNGTSFLVDLDTARDMIQKGIDALHKRLEALGVEV